MHINLYDFSEDFKFHLKTQSKVAMVHRMRQRNVFVRENSLVGSLYYEESIYRYPHFRFIVQWVSCNALT